MGSPLPQLSLVSTSALQLVSFLFSDRLMARRA
jgi:hypothetical protein